MQEKIDNFNDLVANKAKTSKENANKAVQILYSIYQQNKDYELIVDRLVFASHVVATEFTKRYIATISKVDTEDICRELIKVLKNSKTLQSSLPVTFSIIAMGMLKSNSKQSFSGLLNFAIKKCEDTHSVFSETRCKAFKDHLLDKCNGMVFELDYTEWHERDIKRFYRFISTIISNEENIKNISYIKKINEWVKKYNLNTNPISQTIGTNSAKKMEMSQPSTKEKLSEVSAPYKQVEMQKNSKNEPVLNDNLVQELNKLFENAFVKNNAFKSLEDQITASRAEIIKLHEQIKDKDDRLAMLSAQKLSLETALKEKETELTNVNERLKNSFAFDEAKKNQEIVTLKKDISRSLKLASEDYKEIMKTETTEMNDEFLKDIIMQIFKTLNKFGIDI